jgi:hydrogenase maturation protease
MSRGPRTLVLGYGNSGRLDDGLGPAFCRALEARLRDGWASSPISIRDAYQLSVEHASDVADHEVVVFVDATLPGAGPFIFERVEPSMRRAEFSTHSVSPAGIAGLARQVFGADTAAFTLGIRGVEFGGFGEGLSAPARSNLNAALEHFIDLWREGALFPVGASTQLEEPVSGGAPSGRSLS